MRTLLIIVLVLALAVGAIALYLFATTPKSAAPLTMPLAPAHRALLAHVPASADAFALAPTAALLDNKLHGNPVTRDATERFLEQQPMPPPWLLGRADLVAWRTEKRTAYAIRLDAIRSLLVRVWLAFGSSVDARTEGEIFLINADPEPPLDARELDELLRVAQPLPAGDVLVIQRNSERGAYPPIGRPAASSVRVTPREIVIISRADARNAAAVTAPVTARFPSGALLAVTFARPPRILGDVRRLLAADIEALVGSGGSIALYDVDTGTLLPSPKGVIAVPSSEAARGELSEVMAAANLIGQTAEANGQLLVSFDRRSMPLYLEDAFVPATWPANQWSMRVDPDRLVPLLEKLGDNTALRFAAPRIHRSARDLRRWIAALRAAEFVEIAASSDASSEELRVRVASK